MDALLVLLALGDVLADAAIAPEDAGRVEYRLAADADPDLIAGIVEPAQFHVSEWLVRLEQRDMLGPCVGGHVDVVLFPAFLADRRKGLHVDPLRSGSAHRREAELLVLFPVHVGGKLGEAAEAFLVLAHHLFGLLALYELTDMAADHVYRLQQALLGFAGFAAGETEHADRLSIRDDRKNECAVDAHVARRTRPGSRRRTRVLADIGGPQRLSRLPYLARQPDARAVSEFAGCLDKALDRGVRHAPGVGKAQHPGLLVHAKVSPALPAFRFAHRANRRLQPLRCVVRVGEVAAHRVFQCLQLLRALALRDVLADTAIALEGGGW